MWTPKRILILLAGMALFATLYGFYAFFLGGFDGLPLLPSQYLRAKGPDSELDTKPPPPGESDKKLLEAFGAECPELGLPIRLYLRSRGLAVAAKEFSIEPDGRVKLAPFSACLFPKGKGDNKEINTVRCDVAFLTMDQPVKNVADIGSRKITKVELRAKHANDDKPGQRGILITNNRRTPQKTDDLEVRVTNAPLYYEDQKNLIWTEGFVQMLDTQTQPQPTRITAKGMELQLARDSNPTRSKTPKTATKGKGESVNGVETILLHSNVDMHLFVDPKSGFLASTQNSKTTAKEDKQPARTSDPVEKSHVIIRTNGPFHYDLTQELARFQSPQPSGSGGVLEPVTVTRTHKLQGKEKHDQLTCDQLELQFRRKVDAAPAKKNDPDRGAEKEIETALAIVRPGQNVKLAMETENLSATGKELLYRCASATSGPQTTLKGQPMLAFKEGHRIEARELHLIGADKNGMGQKAMARGPGQIDLFDKTKLPNQNRYPTHAVWRDVLTSHKVNEDGKLLDLLILTGDASFIDEDHKQELNGQKLQVWLEADTSKPLATTKEGTEPATGRQRPRRLEAFDKVSAFSPELIVRHTNHLIVRFKDGAMTEGALPDVLPKTSPVSVQNGKQALSPGASAPSVAPPSPGGNAAPAQSNPEKKERKPIELQADDVTAFVNRVGSKNDLQEVVTSGNVRVVQEAQNPKEKGLDIDGEMLNLLHNVAGDILYVHGDSRKPAKLQSGEMTILGPKVTINQRDNMADVDGVGAMHLPSNTKLDGGKTTKPGSRLVIHWNEAMLFNGKFAEFKGGVVAYQDGGALKCQTMEVTLDREVSFKEGQKGGQTAKVEKMVCGGKVFVAEEAKDPSGKLVSYRQGAFTQLNVDNLEGPTMGAGPGFVSSWGKGDSDMTPGAGDAPAEPKSDKKPESMKLTRIEFEGRMFSNAKDNTRTSKFYDNVEVFHLPAKEPTIPINRTTPPKDGFYLRCDLLSVYTRQVNGKSSQLMRGERNVTFRTDEFFGRADIVKFDESTDQVIFEANEGSTVTIDKVARTGVNNQVIRGKKILYKRTTGEFILDGVRSIQSRLELPHDRPRFTERNHVLALARNPIAEAFSR